MNHKHIAAALLFLIPSFANPLHAQDNAESRVNQLLSQLTLDEKIKLLGGVDSFYTNAIDRLKIPRLKMSDGPVGTRNDGPSTAYPAGVALAATWDPALAEREGKSLGQDARARGDHFLLGPGVNIYREPQNGRNFEYFGEDPFLAGEMAVGYINGVQSMDVAACVKHFACNNQETLRDTINAQVDERTLHEIYLPAFEAAVTKAHVRSVMAAYNRVNGDYMTANHTLLTDVLKNSWGFDGVLMSDWGATHDVLGPVQAGMDLEMPGPKYLNKANLQPLIDAGKLSPTAFDDKIRRLLRVMLTMHWQDLPQKDTTIPLDNPADNDVALTVARESIVLLKNEKNLLPLDLNKPQTIAVVGPNAAHYVSGGGSSRTDPFHSITVLQGLQQIAGNNIKLVSVPFNALSRDTVGDFAQASKFDHNELQAGFYNNTNLSGNPITRIDHAIQFNWHRRDLPINGITTRAFSARWTGKITPTETGPYLFVLNSDDGSRVKIDDKIVLDDWTEHATRLRTATINLNAGQTYSLVVEYFNTVGDAVIDFGWGKPPELLTAENRQQISRADAVLACVGTYESEGEDRSYELSEDQSALLTAVTAQNAKTIIVLNAGGNVAMANWIDHTAALVDAWYPGQAGGQAVAEILFGKVNPSGHLPDTFEQVWADSPAFNHYPGDKTNVEYAEGIYVGYRWYDSKKREPRFPFGHGLSYTTFTMSDLKITPSTGANDSYTVSATITNTGKQSGASVAQIYVRPQAGGIDRPYQELKGFARVELEPGQSKTISIPLNRRSFSYWDVQTHNWKVIPGNYEIAIGASSRDIRGTQTIAVR